jgi:SAM-dependent methyltransferase
MTWHVLTWHMRVLTWQVQLAHELRGLHQRMPHCAYNRSELVQLDLSAASTRLTRQRLAARGLLVATGSGGEADASASAPTADNRAVRADGPLTRLLVGSLLTLPALRLGTFDYINVCGVLHHLPDPTHALQLIARHALAPGGGLGMMVYGTYGRSGVYETQAMLRLLHARGNMSDDSAPYAAAHAAHATTDHAPDHAPRTAPHHGTASAAVPWSYAARALDAAHLIRALPPTAPLRRNAAVYASDEVAGRMGDAGLHDLLLHAVDTPFTWERVRALAAAADLSVAGALQPVLYEPDAWLHQCNGLFAPCSAAPPLRLLRQRIEQLPQQRAPAVAELISGTIRKHWVYLTRPAAEADTVAVDGGGAADEAVAHEVAADRAADRSAAGSAMATVTATGTEADLSPCVHNLSMDTRRVLLAHAGWRFGVRTLVQGGEVLSEMPPITSDVMRHVDCRTPLRVLAARAARGGDRATAERRDGASEQGGQGGFAEQWAELYRALHGVGYLFMSDTADDGRDRFGFSRL